MFVHFLPICCCKQKKRGFATHRSTRSGCCSPSCRRVPGSARGPSPAPWRSPRLRPSSGGRSRSGRSLLFPPPILRPAEPTRGRCSSGPSQRAPLGLQGLIAGRRDPAFCVTLPTALSAVSSGVSRFLLLTAPSHHHPSSSSSLAVEQRRLETRGGLKGRLLIPNDEDRAKRRSLLCDLCDPGGHARGMIATGPPDLLVPQG